MSKYIPIVVTILILANIIVSVAMWGQLSYWSLQNYRSPVRAITLPPQPAAPAQTSKLVLVIISGLGNENSFDLDMPVFNQLRQAGASIITQGTFPSYAQTAWATLVTGASPELNDAPPLDKRFDTLNPLQVDTLFSRAKAQGLNTALFGSHAWQTLIPANQLDYSFFAAETDPVSDEVIVEAALPSVENRDSQFVLIQLNGLKLAAETQGGPVTAAYTQTAQQIDSYLGQINQALDLSRSVLVVTSDHGYLADGGFGGNEIEIIEQPLLLMGQNIVPGEYSQAQQIDIAPTIAVLLGLAPPTATQGRILFELLRLNDHDRALVQLRLAQQQANLAQAYQSLLAAEYLPLPPHLTEDLVRAQTIYDNQNMGGTFELASLTQNQSHELMRAARHEFIQSQQAWRLLFVTIIGLIWAFIMWRGRGPYFTVIIVAAIMTVALYHALYQLQGYSYSLSSFPDLTILPLSIARRTAVSMLLGGGLILLVLLISNEGHWVMLLNVGYSFSLLVTFLFTLPLFWAFWQNGLTSEWYLPEPLPAFWQITGLIEVAVAAALGLFLPWPIMILNGFIGLFRRRLIEAEPPTKSPTINGLRW